MVKKSNVVVDVGANIGWYTLLAAKKIGVTGKVVALEPENSNFELLKKSIENNKFTNITPFKLSVSNRNGTQRLWLAKNNIGGHSTVTHNSDNAGVVDVETVTLDTFLLGLDVKFVDFLKVDVEGGEPEVIEGALEYIQSKRVKNILLEWNYEFWVNKKNLIKLLNDHYEVYQIVRSPFLVKKRDENFLLNYSHNADVFLRKRN